MAELQWGLLGQPNVLGSVLQGYQAGTQMRRQREADEQQQQVRSALSGYSQDPDKAIGALISYGALDTANTLSGMRRQQRADQSAERQEQRLRMLTSRLLGGEAPEGFDGHADETMGAMDALAQQVQALPYEQRRAAIQQAAPGLVERGVPEQMIAGFDPTDENLAGLLQRNTTARQGGIDWEAPELAALALEFPDQFEALNKLRPKPAEPYTLGPGAARYGPDGQVIAERPFAPQYRDSVDAQGNQVIVEVGGQGRTQQQVNRLVQPPTGGLAETLSAAFPGIRITSGDRSEAENRRVGGARNSYHLRPGQAVDIGLEPGLTKEAVGQFLREQGFRVRELLGPGDPGHNDHIHVAIDPPTGQQQVASNGNVVFQGGRKPSDAAENKPPSGFRWTGAGDLEAIPGGPGDLRMQQAQQKMEQAEQARANALREQASKASTIMQAVDEALGQVGWGETGAIGRAASAIPGTRAYDLERQIETIKANLGFAELAAMRAASPTGGALGQVTERELAFLQAAVSNLDIGQSEQQLRANLGKVKTHYRNYLNALQQSPAQDGAPAAPQGRTAPQGGAPVQGARRGGDGNWYYPDPTTPGSFPRLQQAPDGRWFFVAANGRKIGVR